MKNWQKKSLWLFSGLLIIGYFAFKLMGVFQEPDLEDSLYVKLERRHLKKIFKGVGILEAQGMKDVIAPLSGKIIFIKSIAEPLVRKNELIYKLQNKTILTDLELAAIEHQKAVVDYEKMKKGPDPTFILERETSYKKALRNYEQKKQKLTHDETLYQKGFISEEEYLKLQKDQELAKLDFEIAQKKYEEAQEAKPPEELQYAQLQVKNKKIEWDRLKEKVEGRIGNLDFNGKIVRIYFDLDDEVNKGDVLMRVIDVDKGYRIMSRVMEGNALELKPGDQAMVSLPTQKESILGSVKQISLVAESIGNSKKYPLEIVFPPLDDGTIPPIGGHVEFEVILEEKADVLSLPLTVITKHKNKNGIWVLDKGDRYFLALKLGINDGGYVEVDCEYKEGKEFIVPRS